MTPWLIILGTALTGGLLVLHGFAKAKEARERMLETYDQLLKQSQDQDDRSEHRTNKKPPEDA